jgi:hypothetical protein
MRRLGQILVLVLMAACAVGAGAFIAVAVYYHRFSTEVATAGASVPATVGAQLSPAAPSLEHAQVTLVRGSARTASGGAVLLRTAPDDRTTAFLSMPASAVLTGEPLSRLDTRGLVRGLKTTMGIGISHVAIVNRPSGVHLVDIAQALAPASVTELQTAGRTIAGTGTDLTDADVLALMWARVHERRVVRCAVAAHQTVDSAQGRGIAATFLGRGGEPTSGCTTRASTPASFVPPRPFFVVVQDYGEWAFVLLAAAAMLGSLATGAIFTRIRSAGTAVAPVLAPRPAAPGPALAVSLAASAPAAPRPSRADRPTPASMLSGFAALSRSGLRTATAIHERVAEWEGFEAPAGATYRSRVRRFVYLHQDALWIGLCAAVAAGILILLLVS